MHVLALALLALSSVESPDAPRGADGTWFSSPPGGVIPADGAIDAEGALARVKTLAADELEGRGAGTEGGHKAGDWIAAELRALGFEPRFEPFQVGPTRCRNVVVVIEGGDPARREEHVVIGAHYDHVGRGEEGNGIDLFGGAGEVHNGADDNASGTAALLEVAEAFARGGRPPARSVVLVFFDGEERGLWGSRRYVEAPALPLEECIAMLNMDMVGRAKTGGMQLIGANSGAGLAERIVAASREVGLPLQVTPYMVPNSDHFSFYSRGVPVAFFNSGLHPQYHRASDDWPLIDADGIARTARLCFRVAVALADSGERPAFAHVPSVPIGAMALEYVQAMTGAGAAGELQRAIYGPIAGAFVRRHGAGLRVDYVVPGTPAAAAGIAPGDVLLRARGRSLAGLLGRARLMGAVERAGRRGEALAVEMRRGDRTVAAELVLSTRRRGSF